MDDFGIKYHAGDQHLEHLLSCLRELYTITVDMTGSKYLGMKIDWDYTAHTVALSMPDYVKKALERFGVTKAAHNTDSPMLYTPPSYGKHVTAVGHRRHLSAASTK